QAEDGIRDFHVTGVQTCALPISAQGCVHRRLGRVAPGGRAALLAQRHVQHLAHAHVADRGGGGGPGLGARREQRGTVERGATQRPEGRRGGKGGRTRVEQGRVER